MQSPTLLQGPPRVLSPALSPSPLTLHPNASRPTRPGRGRQAPVPGRTPGPAASPVIPRGSRHTARSTSRKHTAAVGPGEHPCPLGTVGLAALAAVSIGSHGSQPGPRGELASTAHALPFPRSCHLQRQPTSSDWALEGWPINFGAERPRARSPSVPRELVTIVVARGGHQRPGPSTSKRRL